MVADPPYHNGQREQPHNGCCDAMVELHKRGTFEDRKHSPVAQRPARAPKARAGNPHSSAQRHLYDRGAERGQRKIRKGSSRKEVPTQLQ